MLINTFSFIFNGSPDFAATVLNAVTCQDELCCTETEVKRYFQLSLLFISSIYAFTNFKMDFLFSKWNSEFIDDLTILSILDILMYLGLVY